MIEHALARLWMSWGMAPKAMIGHSIGEYVAACLAGVFSLEDALDLVAARGRLVQELPPGAMLAVHLSEAEILDRVGPETPELALAAINRPSLCVLSGTPEAIERVERDLAAQAVVCRRLLTSHAFHSPLMEPVLAAFAERVRRVARKPPEIPFLSNVTGTWITAGEATDPLYWARHLRQTVRFSEAVERVLRETDAGFLEVGPGTTLAALVRQHPARSSARLVLSSLRHPKEGGSERAALLTTLGRLWLAGAAVDWKGFSVHERRRRVPLPTYPFERQRYWYEPAPSERGLSATERKPDLADWFYVPSWRRSALAERLGTDHRPRQRWLLLGGGEWNALAERLTELGQEVAIQEEVEPLPAGVQRIVHLGCASLAEETPRRDLAAEHLRRGYKSLIALAQALGRRGSPEPLRIDVVSSQMQEVVGGDLLWPEKAALLGPLKVIPKEIPGVSCRSIDTLPAASPRERTALIERLCEELLADSNDQVVAWRGSHRWVQTFEPVRLGEAGESGDLARLRPGGCYLITGGLGGIGLSIAELLARTVRAKLVLLGRSGLPASRVRQVARLEDLGAEVLVLAADVASEEEMRRAVGAARERFGRIDGVVHAAGVSTGAFLQLRSAEAAAAVLAPKVQGTRVLEAVLGDEPDFLVVCSSRSALFGQAGGADYCAANAFLDAWAHACRSAGGPFTLAIDWCAWRQVGMLAAAAGQARPAEEPAELDDGEPVEHPLFDRRRSEPGRDVFHTRFSAARQWVADEHRIAGQPVIPGTTYLEMARAAFALRQGPGPVELHDVFFLTPVRLREDEEKEVRLELEASGDGFDFKVACRSGAGTWDETMLGRVRPLAPEPPKRHDLPEILARCDRGRVLAAVEDEKYEDLGPRWQTVQQAWLGDGEVLGTLELPALLAGDLAACHLHPALLDRAAGLGEQFLVDLTDGFYLPLAYRSLKIRAPLTRKLWSHARLLEDRDYSRKETISFDVVLMDEDGTELVEIRGYGKKRVNNPTEQLRARSPLESQPAEAEKGSGADPFARVLEMGVSPEEGIEVFRRLLAHRVPPQVVISPTDLNAALAEAAAATSSSLLDKAATAADIEPTGSAARHARPALSTPYAAPRTELEGRIAALWREMLGVTEVGLHDNFFELGGDSVLGIQIVARARRAGLEIAPGQLFEFQTVAQLAAALGAGTVSEPDRPAESRPLAVFDRERLATLLAEVALDDMEDTYRLAPVQQGVLFHSLYAPRSGDYVLQVGWTVEGGFDAEAFDQAWRAVIARHPILRTAFFWEGLDEPLQVVRRTTGLPWTRVDWRALGPAAQRERLRAFLEEDRRRGFDLRLAPLMRLVAFDLGGDSVQIVWSYHHLLLDGWSVPLVFREIFTLYAGIRQGRRIELPDVRPYRDYVAWLEANSRAEDEAFWRRALAGFTAPTPLPAERPAAEEAGRSYRLFQGALSQELSEGLRELSRRHRLTLNTLFQGAWALLLGRTSGEEDVVFGGVVSGRPPSLLGVEQMVGLFINTLPVRVRLRGDAPLLDGLHEIQAEQSAAREHEHVPLLEVQKHSEVPSGQALFESLVIFENLPQGEDLVGAGEGPVIRDLFRSEGRTGYPLTLMVFPADRTVLHLIGDADRFSTAALQRLAGQLETLLAAITEDPARRPGDLPLLTEAERHQVVHEPNDTDEETLAARAIHEPFEARAAEAPDAVALTLGDRSVTYAELNGRADQLARHLRRLGVGLEVTVALEAGRSLEMVEGLLGVLKAGGAYVPIAPDTPPLRRAAILEATRPRLVLTREELLDHGPSEDRSDLPPLAGPEGLAYVVHTSGSTGAPKGICGRHGGVVNYLGYLLRQWDLGPSDVALQIAGLSFDASLRDLIGPLSAGARVVLVEEDEAHDPQVLRRAIERHGVTCLPSVVPTLLAELLDAEGPPGESVRLVLASGEPLPAATRERARRVFSPAVQVVNQYGPTESTLTTTVHRLTDADASTGTVPAGRPIANVRLHVLDRDLAPMPLGVAGELWIAGAGLTRGYLGRPDLTAAAFRPDPLSGRPGERMYRTGDLARRRPDGTLEILGRIDRQIKLRGIRVEPGEIESALLGHPGIREAAVVAWSGTDDGPAERLVGYVAVRPAEEGSAPDPDQLRGFLQGRLPAALVPGAFVVLDALPKTPNGKVDRKALPRPEGEGLRRPAALALPQTPAEIALAEVWADLLGVREIGRDDHFFALGGDSLLAIRLLGKARQRGLSLELRQVFAHPRLGDLAAVAEGSAPLAAAPPPETGPIPLTPNQHWFFQRPFVNPHHWNVSLLCEVDELLDHPLDKARLAAALRHLVNYHEALRLRFFRDNREGEGWRQVAAEPDGEMPFSTIDLSGLPVGGRLRGVVEAAAAKVQQSLHLSQGPLFRLVAFELGAGVPDRLLFVGHHLSLDHVSVRLLAEDLEAIYRQLVQRGPGEEVRVPPRLVSFKTWSERLTAWAGSPEAEAEADWWLGLPWERTVRLPLDHPGGHNTARSRRAVSTAFNAGETEALLRELPRELGVTAEEVLATGIADALARWTGSPVQLLSLVGHGRHPVFADLDVTRTIGWFAIDHPVVLELPEADDPTERLRGVAAQLRRVPREGLGYGVLRYLSRHPEIAAAIRRLPAAEVHFNYRGNQGIRPPRPDSLLRVSAGSLGAFADPSTTRPALVYVSAAVVDGRLQIDWTYSESCHRQSTIEKLAEHGREALRSLLAPGGGQQVRSEIQKGEQRWFR